MAATITKCRRPWYRFILNQVLRNPIRTSPYLCRKICSTCNVPPRILHFQTPISDSHLGSTALNHRRWFSLYNPVQELLAQLEREKQRDRDDKRRRGVETKDDEEDDLDREDFIKIQDRIDKLEKEKANEGRNVDLYENLEPSDSESEDDERFSPEAVKKRTDEFKKKIKRHENFLKNFAEAETLDDAYKWMEKIDKFEEQHLRLPLEYRVIGELINRLKVASGKDKFILQHKLNRAVRLMDWKENYDPNKPDNFGSIERQKMGPNAKFLDAEAEEEDEEQKTRPEKDDDEDYDDIKDRDDVLLEKLNAIDKKLEEKLAELDRTFGKKGRNLEEEIKELADERNSLTEKKRIPLYRKGFDVKLFKAYRTGKVTKGGRIFRYVAILVCGNYNGIVGYAKAKGPSMPVAVQKAHEKCFQNLHYIERHEEHTIAHAVQAKYKKTKVYLWPAPTRTGVIAAPKSTQTILGLAGFKNVRTKVIGSRNSYNVIKAVFKALNAIETPKDVQEKLGRTVVEKYLL